MVDDQINKVALGKSQPVKKNSENGIPFAVACHPKVKEIGKLIKGHSRIFYIDEEVQKVFHLLQRFHKAFPENKGIHS